MPNETPHRLYSKARILSFTRAKSKPSLSISYIKETSRSTPPFSKSKYDLFQSSHTKGANTKAQTEFYMGKRVAYVYRAKREINGSNIRVIWGRVTRPHGTGGVVRAKFTSNLPPKAFGASARIVSLEDKC